MYGGRGGGKSWAVARALLIMGYQKPLRVLCTRETQSSIKDSVHQLLADQIYELGLEAYYHVKETEIDGVNGSLFTFVGLRQQDIGKIKSYEGYDVAWVEEAAFVSEKSWSILIPTIRKPGSEIWITFNPELDTDPVYERFIVNTPPETRVMNINWRDNPWFPRELDLERKHLKKTDFDAYENVWEGKCRAAVDGAIYHKEVAAAIEGKRIKDVPYDPLLKVHAIFDLGFNDQTSIIFVQKSGSQIAVIDYLEDRHRTLDEYASEVKKKDYNLGTLWLPHDGAAKNLQTGMSPLQVMRRQGFDVRLVQTAKIEVGIKAARQVFAQCYFDEIKTKRLLECLKRYRRRIPTTTGEPSSPIHDEFSHGADAFRYMGLIAQQLSNDDDFMRKIEYDNRGIV
jgi:phage terminase large subunit